MALYEGIEEIVNQVGIQTATTVIIAFRDADAGLQPTTTAIHKQPQRQSHGRLMLEKPLFNWDAKDRYAELINVKMEVTNILETKAYELNDEEKVILIKNWIGLESQQLLKRLTYEEKEKSKSVKGLF